VAGNVCAAVEIRTRAGCAHRPATRHHGAPEVRDENAFAPPLGRRAYKEISAMLFVLYGVLSIVVAAVAFLGVLLFYRFSGKTFDSNGVQIFYRDEGGSGTPVVLIHGLGVNSD